MERLESREPIDTFLNLLPLQPFYHQATEGHSQPISKLKRRSWNIHVESDPKDKQGKFGIANMAFAGETSSERRRVNSLHCKTRSVFPVEAQGSLHRRIPLRVSTTTIIDGGGTRVTRYWWKCRSS